MPALANVVAAAQQIGSNATQLSTGTSATAQSIRTFAPQKSHPSHAEQVAERRRFSSALPEGAR